VHLNDSKIKIKKQEYKQDINHRMQEKKTTKKLCIKQSMLIYNLTNKSIRPQGYGDVKQAQKKRNIDM
jgi:hypothetical protein